MRISRSQALKLLTATELDVFEASLAENLRQLDGRQLRAKIRRSRTLRDKYQDLLRRQRIATRLRTATKTGRSGFENERTAQKAQVFEAVVQRFEKRLTAVEAAAAREAGRTRPARVAEPAETMPARAVPAGSASAEPARAKLAPVKSPAVKAAPAKPAPVKPSPTRRPGGKPAPAKARGPKAEPTRMA